jgi:hypothetical protein
MREKLMDLSLTIFTTEITKKFEEEFEIMYYKGKIKYLSNINGSNYSLVVEEFLF